MLRELLLVTSLTSASVAVAADGESLFNGVCAACHQLHGAGSPGLAPPLANKGLWSGLGASAPSYLQGVMLAGMSGAIEVDGQKYLGLIMPPQDRMTDAELAAIGNYILGTLNGVGGASLTEASVGRVRAAPPSHAALREIRKNG